MLSFAIGTDIFATIMIVFCYCPPLFIVLSFTIGADICITVMLVVVIVLRRSSSCQAIQLTKGEYRRDRLATISSFRSCSYFEFVPGNLGRTHQVHNTYRTTVAGILNVLNNTHGIKYIMMYQPSPKLKSIIIYALIIYETCDLLNVG